MAKPIFIIDSTHIIETFKSGGETALRNLFDSLNKHFNVKIPDLIICGRG
jgi:hypothetical protein